MSSTVRAARRRAKCGDSANRPLERGVAPPAWPPPVNDSMESLVGVVIFSGFVKWTPQPKQSSVPEVPAKNSCRH